MKELIRVNSDPKFRRFISEEEDQLFIKNSLIAEGEKRGKYIGAEKQKEQTIIEMLRNNISIDLISKVLKISTDQVKKYEHLI